MTMASELGELLERTRTERGHSQAEAYAACGFGDEGQSTWSQWELGQRSPRPERYGPLAEYAKITKKALAEMVERDRLARRRHQRTADVELEEVRSELGRIQRQIEMLNESVNAYRNVADEQRAMLVEVMRTRG